MPSSYERKTELQVVWRIRLTHIRAKKIVCAQWQLRELFKDFPDFYGDHAINIAPVGLLFTSTTSNKISEVTTRLVEMIRLGLGYSLNEIRGEIVRRSLLGILDSHEFVVNAYSSLSGIVCNIFDDYDYDFSISYINETLEHVWFNFDSGIFAHLSSFKDLFADSCYKDLIADHMYYYPRHLGFLFHGKRFEGLCEWSKSPEQVLKMVQTNVSRSIDLNNKHGSNKITLQQLVVAAATDKEMDLNAVYILISMDPIAALKKGAGKKRKREHDCANTNNTNV